MPLTMSSIHAARRLAASATVLGAPDRELDEPSIRVVSGMRASRFGQQRPFDRRLSDEPQASVLRREEHLRRGSGVDERSPGDFAQGAFLVEEPVVVARLARDLHHKLRHCTAWGEDIRDHLAGPIPAPSREAHPVRGEVDAGRAGGGPDVGWHLHLVRSAARRGRREQSETSCIVSRREAVDEPCERSSPAARCDAVPSEPAADGRVVKRHCRLHLAGCRGHPERRRHGEAGTIDGPLEHCAPGALDVRHAPDLQPWGNLSEQAGDDVAAPLPGDADHVEPTWWSVGRLIGNNELACHALERSS